MQAGLKEICNHFHGKRTDAYIDTLVQEVEKANQSLFEVLYVNSVKRGVQQEAWDLRRTFRGGFGDCFEPEHLPSQQGI